jgi:hypothetical protein
VLAILTAVAIANLASNIARGISWTTSTGVQAQFFALLALGLLVVGMLEKTYSAIPPRCVRQFRGWVLGAATVARELARHGFVVQSVHRQFVLPIAVHKAIGSRGFTLGVEALFARAGLLRLLGSPVTVVAVRQGSGRP